MHLTAASALGQQFGSIGGSVVDADFDAPLSGARVEITETGQAVQTDARGNYFFGELAPGTYTLLFRMEGYTNRPEPNVLVSAGELTDRNVEMTGDFTEMEPYVVEETLKIGGADEVGLLNLRFESPSLIDSVGRDLLSRAGTGSADEALNLVSGATVAADSTPVIRGLPDRYVNSQINGVRVPSANQEKRAVELDQYPSTVIESVQVSKTFTPDQQGDASGGAVNIVTVNIPDEPIFNFNAQSSYNSQASGADGFLSYAEGGVGEFGREADSRPIQPVGENWTGDVGVSPADAPALWKLSTALGGGRELDNGVRIGGFVSLFYERDAGFRDNEVADSYWLAPQQGLGLTPQRFQVQGDDEFVTQLFDISRSSQLVQWGGLVSGGIEWGKNKIAIQSLYTHTAEDVVVLAEDTRGKESFYPGYDPTDPAGPGVRFEDAFAAPWIRTETLEYTERTTGTLQLSGSHAFEIPSFGAEDFMVFRDPEITWTAASSFADLDQPDKRLFGSLWIPDTFRQNSNSIRPEQFEQFKPAANILLGNLQRTFKTIEEDSNQAQLNAKLPFDQWSGDEGYLKVGYFDDDVTRTFDQESFSNFGEDFITFPGGWNDFWSSNWQNEDHPITQDIDIDVDYDGQYDIDAMYGMFDLPITSNFKLVGGVRFENTRIVTVLDPGEDADYLEPGSTQPRNFNPEDIEEIAEPFTQDDVLPALSMIYEFAPAWSFRAAYSETVARPTFRELVPIIQQDFLGGPIFVGNPTLELAGLTNYDLRLDYRPAQTSLVSVSYFYKDVERPIEYVQAVASFGYTTPINYTDGELSGVELEMRQGLGVLWDGFEGLNFGANATFIDSEVNLPQSEIDQFDSAGIDLASRDATGAPEYLYNIFFTYDVPDTGTQLGLFYTVRGDTLVRGDGLDSVANYIPAVYQLEFDTLNFSLRQRLTDHWNLRLQAKNLTNPTIEEVYRSDVTGPDLTTTSFTRGVEFSVAISANYRF